MTWPLRGITLLFICALGLTAQNSRQSYRSAYSTWRQADPKVEGDSARPSPALFTRIDDAAQQAARFQAAKILFLRRAAQRVMHSLVPIRTPVAFEADLTGGRYIQTFVAAEKKAAEASVKVFEGDRDPRIIQVREAWERERAALAALAVAVDQRSTLLESANLAAVKEDDARQLLWLGVRPPANPSGANTSNSDAGRGGQSQGSVGSQVGYSQLGSAILEAADVAEQESALWSKYYRSLRAGVETPSPVKP